MVPADSLQWNVAIGGDAAETGVGAGSYDIRQSVWHVNVGCSPQFTFPVDLANDGCVTSVAALKLTEAAGGESSAPSLDGRTLLPTAVSFHTICTVLRLLWHSLSCPSVIGTAPGLSTGTNSAPACARRHTCD